MRYIFGLGNPGTEYACTRHNVGVETLEKIAAFYQVRLRKRCFHLYQSALVSLPTGPVTLIFPLTYMNESGAIVNGLVKEGDEVIVICDQMDLPPGKLRVRNGGHSAGHNGLKSMMAALPQNFLRWYIGTGHPEPDGDVPDYVLSPFPPNDRLLVEKAEDIAKETLCAYLEGESLVNVQQKANSFKA